MTAWHQHRPMSVTVALLETIPLPTLAGKPVVQERFEIRHEATWCYVTVRNYDNKLASYAGNPLHWPELFRLEGERMAMTPRAVEMFEQARRERLS